MTERAVFLPSATDRTDRRVGCANAAFPQAKTPGRRAAPGEEPGERLRRSDGQHKGVVGLHDAFDVAACCHGAPGAELHADPAQHGDVGIEDVGSGRHRASRPVSAVEHEAPVPVPREEVRGGQTGGTSAHDCDGFAARREGRRCEGICGGTVAEAQSRLGGNALQPADVDGGVDVLPPARLPAGRGADGGERPREREALHQDREGRAAVTGRDAPDRCRDVGVRGAGPGARRLAVAVVLGEQELDRAAAGGSHPVAGRAHPVAVGGLRGARRKEAARALVLHEADHARGVVGQPLAEAKCGDGYAQAPCRVEQGRAVGDPHRPVVDDEIRHGWTPPGPLRAGPPPRVDRSTTSTASEGHTCRQLPHRMQRDWSISCRS